MFQTPIFVLSDLDLGMNNWMSDPFVYPDQAVPPRQSARRRAARGARRKVGTLSRRRRRRHPVPHAARHRSPDGVVLHARLRPRHARALLREAGRLQSDRRPPGEEVRDREAVRAAAGHRSPSEREDRLHRLRHHRLSRWKSRATSSATSTASRPATSVCARCPSPTM